MRRCPDQQALHPHCRPLHQGQGSAALLATDQRPSGRIRHRQRLGLRAGRRGQRGVRRRPRHRGSGGANRSRGIPAAVAKPTLRHRAAASQPKRGVHHLHQAHLPAVQLVVDQRQTHRSRLGQDGVPFGVKRQAETGVAAGGQE